ncbi:helix-turn-helix domain-containing protein [Nocardioides sp. DS6]|uniref:Helix-turn-helix domain-containing protein n=1 Tax=Nocardioides eburneus TaxID=3231482 RepID=A0ABV3SZU3_9ACTN
MSQAGVEVPQTALPPQITQQLQASVPAFAERVTRRVQAEIEAYAGPADGRRQRLISMAVAESARVFIRSLGGRRLSTAGVDDLFRRMGYGEASEGHDLDALREALGIAAREGWRGLQSTVVAAGLPASTLGRLGDDLGAFIHHLAGQADAGRLMAERARERDVGVNRSLLMQALRDDADLATVHHRAGLAGWPLPARVVAIAATADNTDATWPDTEVFEGKVLTDTAATPALYLTPAEHTAPVVDQLRGLGRGVRVAQSWPVELADAGAAFRWATRALELVDAGAIPRQQVVDCAKYRTHLWLHAEPALRRQLAQELLSPLFAETPNSREILSETLLVWLETRDSAPAIAAVLGVHPQTVRYRWRRINELFGEALRDPEFVVQLTMVLKASVPLWVAGDQSDFERYWNEEMA